MMFNDIETPRGRHWAVPLMLAVLLGIYGGTFSADSLMVWVWFGGAAVFGIWALVNFVHHVAHAVWGMLREERELTFKMSQNFYAEKLAEMTEDQLKALRAGKPIFEAIPSQGGRIDKLFGVEAYDYILWFILVRSNSERVYPINNFNKETYHFDVIGDHAVDDYHQARNATQWLCWWGFAKWGTGNQSAQWVDGFTPDKVLQWLDWTRDMYDPVVEELQA